MDADILRKFVPIWRELDWPASHCWRMSVLLCHLWHVVSPSREMWSSNNTVRACHTDQNIMIIRERENNISALSLIRSFQNLMWTIVGGIAVFCPVSILCIATCLLTRDPISKIDNQPLIYDTLWRHSINTWPYIIFTLRHQAPRFLQSVHSACAR